jgi:hypothetical protein
VITALNVGVLGVNLLLTVPGSRSAPQRSERMRVLDDLRVERPSAAEQTAASDGSREDPPASAGQRVPVTLDEEQLAQLRDDVYREERRWRRRASVLHGLARLEKNGVLPSLARPVRGRILEMATGFAERRTALERAAMTCSEMDELERLRGDLHAFDESEASRIQDELHGILNPAEAKQVVRVIVPGLG